MLISVMTATSASVLLNRLQARARLRHLQVLVKLAELLNLKRCAEALGLSQPAVTQVLADLERLVELPLFDRHSRGVRITPAGQQLLPVARRMLDALAEGSETLTAMKRDGDGLVRVAAITAAVSGLLVRVVPAFALAHPKVQVHVRESEVDQCAPQLARHEVDIVVCPPFTALKSVADRFMQQYARPATGPFPSSGIIHDGLVRDQTHTLFPRPVNGE